jgi:hypothetical protein
MVWKKKYSTALILSFFLVIFISSCFLICSVQARSSKGSSNRYKIALEVNKVAIFPFADHSYSKFDSVKHFDKGQEVAQYLHDAFQKKNIKLVDASSVKRLLLAEDAIRILREADNPASYEWNILNSTYHHLTERRIADNIIKKHDKTAVLSESRIKFLAEMLGADAIVRGVILDKTPKSFIEKDSMLKPDDGTMAKRLIPFFMRGKFCYALTGNYETGLFPLQHSRPIDFFPSFNPNTKVIEVLIFIQNPKTGEIAWSSSSKVVYSAKGPYISGDFRSKLKKQVNLSIQEFISSLSRFKDSWVLVEEEK